MNNNTPAGIYIHIPFCVKKCEYCDFFSITNLSFEDEFINALKKEIEFYSQSESVKYKSFKFDTIYLGGGTPSVLSSVNVSKILETVYKGFDIINDCEITIEANPGTLNKDKLKEYLNSGINRINFGVQSFDDNALKILGRIHTSKQAVNIIDKAFSLGFENIGFDLIYGIPGQSEKAWIYDLQQAVKLRPKHMSCYMLTYEKGTPLYIKREKKLIKPLTDLRVKNFFEICMEFLESNSYVQYEISNFALDPGFALNSGDFDIPISRHNIKYWNFIPYLGFGPSAHSFIPLKRYWNYSDIKLYIDHINCGQLPIAEKEILTKEQQMIEAVYLGLRQKHGINIKNFNKLFNVNFLKLYENVLTDLQKKQYVEINDNRCFLTAKGIFFLDSIVAMLI